MIPTFNGSGVLPPFVGADSTNGTLVSPYQATIVEFVTQFATTPERREILRGLLRYREALRGIGIADGYQWLNGSFCSDVEQLEGRAPRDVDLVTYAHRPANVRQAPEFANLVNNNLDLFLSQRSKAAYKVDAYFTDLDMRPTIIVERASYWHGVFGHQRVTSLWKGMIRIELICQDSVAIQLLDDIENTSTTTLDKVAGEENGLTEPLDEGGATDA